MRVEAEVLREDLGSHGLRVVCREEHQFKGGERIVITDAASDPSRTAEREMPSALTGKVKTVLPFTSGAATVWVRVPLTADETAAQVLRDADEVRVLPVGCDPVAEEREAVVACERALEARYPASLIFLSPFDEPDNEGCLWEASLWQPDCNFMDVPTARGETGAAAALALRALLMPEEPKPEEQVLKGVDAQAMAESLIAAAEDGEPAAVSVMKTAEKVVRELGERAGREQAVLCPHEQAGWIDEERNGEIVSKEGWWGSRAERYAFYGGAGECCALCGKPLPPKPLPETVEECADELRLANAHFLPQAVHCPRWHSGRKWFVRHADIEYPYALTELAAWQAAVRKLREEAAKCP